MDTDTQYIIEKTYVHIDVQNYSGTGILSSYALNICPLTFVPNFTTSDLLSSDRYLSNKKIKWDFGDDTFSTDLTATHTYRWPGKYQVKLTLFDRYGTALESEYSPTILIKNFIADDIEWGDYGKFVYDVPASKIGDPLSIYTRNSWQSYNALSATGITINLYASGAAGDYISEKNFFDDKWSHLRLLSRFYEIQDRGNTKQYVLVDTITAKTTEIYAYIQNNDIKICSKDTPGSILTGVTGYNEIYYVDDRVKNWTTRENPIFLVASFDTAKFEDEFSQRRELYNYIDYPPAGFQMYEPTFLPIIKVRHNPARQFSITTTGIDGEGTLSTTVFRIPEISWTDTTVPFLVKFKDFENYTTKTYWPLSSSMVTNATIEPQSAYDVKFGIISYKDDNTWYPVTGVQWYEDFPVKAPQLIGGFYKGYFVADQSAYNCVLTAECTVTDPTNFPKDALIAWISIPQYSYVQRIFRQQFYDSCGGSVTMVLTGSSNFVKTNQHRQVYSISVAPSGAGKGNDYHTWLADSKTDTLLKFSLYGQLLSTIPLSAAPTLVNDIVIPKDFRNPELLCASPNSMALDSRSDIWVSLFDTGKAIKIDGVKGVVIAEADPPGTQIMYLASAFGTTPFLSGFAGEGIFLPASIDTDYEDNLWVAYTHPVSNFIAKYDTVGTLLTAIFLPPVISPVELCIDRNKYIWLTTINHTSTGFTLTGRNDYVYKFDTYGNIASGFPLSGFRMLNNITVDGGQNAWVSHDRETITKIDQRTNDRTDYMAGSAFLGLTGTNQTSYIHSIVGLTCDTSDYVWAINDFEKKIQILDTYMPPDSAFRFKTQLDLPYPPFLPEYPLSAWEIRQFQAYGDWFGFRWINKYMVPVTVTRLITGSSDFFNILPSSGVNMIAKQNENWDAEGYYKSLRYQEVLLDKDKLFTDFIGGILGDIKGQPYELGKTVYEKVANFVDNKANITTCNLQALVSLCQELSIPFEEYNYPFPPQLERLINTLSIKHKHLWGEKNTYNLNFNPEKAYLATQETKTNLGKELSVFTSVVSSGVPIVAYETFAETYSLVNFSQIPGIPLETPVPLSSYSYDWGWGLVAPRSLTGTEIKNYYKFYEFKPQIQGSFYNNTINWDDSLTTLSPTNSSFNDWSRDNGIMQTLISYEMSKGFRLFTSAADITYNN
jgi:PKD repeat protein